MGRKSVAREIAVKLYELDVRVYESTDSTMGKVFPSGKELAVQHMVKQIHSDKKHFFKKETTLISNMINTIQDKEKAKKFKNELDEIRLMIEEYSPAQVITDSFESNISNLKNRFSKEDKKIICIGREYGSGGHEVGFRLAERLGISYYDNEILKMSSDRFDSNLKVITEHDEKVGKQSFFDENPLDFLLTTHCSSHRVN